MWEVKAKQFGENTKTPVGRIYLKTKGWLSSAAFQLNALKCESLASLIIASLPYPGLGKKWAFHLSHCLQSVGCHSIILLIQFYLFYL